MPSVSILIAGLIAYLVIVNLIAFALYGSDKRKAKRGEWRISEKTLLGIAAIGGSFGALAGMQTFRHKTQHAIFKFGVPLMVLIHMILLGFLFGRGM